MSSVVQRPRRRLSASGGTHRPGSQGAALLLATLVVGGHGCRQPQTDADLQINTIRPATAALADVFEWSSTELEKTTSLKWADYDGDGDLDLAVGNQGQVNRVYQNEGGGVFSSVWASTELEATQSVSWGDYDGDGDPDLAVGNDGQSNRIYRNDGGGAFVSVWASTELEKTQSVSWGDYDGDGDLDLAVGNTDYLNSEPDRIYRNDDGVFTPAWTSTEMACTRSVTWGDYDADGDLDLAMGNRCGPDGVYQNDGSGGLSPVWMSPFQDETLSLSWGDYDGDGDLDLAVGNEGESNRIYRNDGEGVFSSVWESPETERSYEVAWGDHDGDGDLDLAVANHVQPNRIYQNDGGGVFRSVWVPASAEYLDWTTTVGWGDYDGDGDLDLAVGNDYDKPNRIYQNDGGGIFKSVRMSSISSSGQDAIWGDYDGDGDVDLAVANSNEPNRHLSERWDGSPHGRLGVDRDEQSPRRQLGGL